MKTKTPKKLMACIIVLIMLMSFALPLTTAGAATAKMKYSSYTLTRGMTLHQTLKVGSTTVSDSKITWKSSDSSIASVDSGGNIKGLKPGTVTVSAKYSGATYKSTITVKNCTQKYSSYTLTRGMTLHQTLLNAQGKAIADSNIVWKSSDTAVATVDAGGNIKGIKPGTAKISAKYRGVTYSKCTITVKNARFKISSTSVYAGKGFQQALYTAQDKKILNSAIVWSSSDESVAVVTKTGYVTVVGEGTCKIRAKWRGTTYSSTVKGVSAVKVPKFTYNTGINGKANIFVTAAFKDHTLKHEILSGDALINTEWKYSTKQEKWYLAVESIGYSSGTALIRIYDEQLPESQRIVSVRSRGTKEALEITAAVTLSVDLYSSIETAEQVRVSSVKVYDGCNNSEWLPCGSDGFTIVYKFQYYDPEEGWKEGGYAAGHHYDKDTGQYWSVLGFGLSYYNHGYYFDSDALELDRENIQAMLDFYDDILAN